MHWILVFLIFLFLVPPGVLLLQFLSITTVETLRGPFTTVYEFFGLLWILLWAYWF
jgi:hypothetical protein